MIFSIYWWSLHRSSISLTLWLPWENFIQRGQVKCFPCPFSHLFYWVSKWVGSLTFLGFFLFFLILKWESSFNWFLWPGNKSPSPAVGEGALSWPCRLKREVFCFHCVVCRLWVPLLIFLLSSILHGTNKWLYTELSFIIFSLYNFTSIKHLINHSITVEHVAWLQCFVILIKVTLSIYINSILK